MRTAIVAFYLFTFSLVSAQSFEDDWEDFELENWTVQIHTADVPEKGLADKTILAEVIFHSEKFDKSISYTVYSSTDIDDKFKEEQKQFLSTQTCSSDPKFSSFKSFSYVYIMKPCERCSFYTVNVREDSHIAPEGESCKALAEVLAQYVRYR
jgi:hypothetical protein